MYPMFFSQNAVKNTKKEKLLKLQPNMAKRMNVLYSISSMNVKAFIITPSSELTDLMCRNGPSKEPSAAMVGPSLPDKKVTNISTALQDKDFLSLGEPIKVGHHSEKRHRKAIDDAWNNMGKSVEFSDKAAEHERIAKYWEEKANTINLSMPESIDFYEHKLEKAKEYHEGLKSGKYPREHSYSLAYAKKAVNEAKKNYELAKKLWGDLEKV